MSTWDVLPLGKQHDRTQFDCGNNLLNEWLQQRAAQFDRRDLSRTFVAVEPGQTQVLGFYALANHRVVYESLPDDQAKGLPRMDIPVVLLGRLGVDRTTQGQGLGAFLLLNALRRIVHISQHVGIRAVEVDAIDAAARNFHLKYGFMPLLDDPQHLLLPLTVVRKLNLPPLN